jgi:hypothetical protein
MSAFLTHFSFRHHFKHPLHLSTDRNQGNPLITFIANHAGCVRVKFALAIHDEQVLVMAMMQFHANCPAAIGCPVHRDRGHVPSIEIAHETDM